MRFIAHRSKDETHYVLDLLTMKRVGDGKGNAWVGDWSESLEVQDEMNKRVGA